MSLKSLILSAPSAIGEQAAKELNQLNDKAKQLDALNAVMPCGHLARYAANEEDGTQYCVVCELESYKKHADFIACIYCGHETAKGPESNAQVLEHIMTCEKRPEKKLMDAIDALVKDQIDILNALRIANECIHDMAFIAHNLNNTDNQAVAKIKARWLEYPIGNIAELLVEKS